MASTELASSSLSDTGDHTHVQPSASRTTAMRVGYEKPKKETVGPSAT
jgi:hypothetical protein